RGCKLSNEIFHECGNNGFPFAQGRQINREDIQPVVQIFAEFTILSHSLQVLVGRSDNANIDSRCARAADCLELALLEHTEELRLKFKRHVSNFIEEQSATIGQREPADMRIDSARKGSAFVSEELAFEEAGRHRCAVHLHQISVSAGAKFVNRLRDDLLASASLSSDQNGCIPACDGLHLTENGAQAAAAPYDRI